MISLLRKSLPAVSERAVSPERTALAAAIAAYTGYLAQKAAADRAEQLAGDAVQAATQAIWRLKGELDEAHLAAVRYLQAQASGTAGEPPRPVREVRDALSDAENHHAATVTVHEALQAEAQPFKNDEWKTSGVQRAIVAVLRAEGASATAAVVAEAMRLQHEIVRVGQVLAFLIKEKAFPVLEHYGSNYGLPADEDIRKAHWRLIHSPPATWKEIVDQHDGAAEWRNALAALQTDANAPLPGAV